jgi:hypothetical protein
VGYHFAFIVQIRRCVLLLIYSKPLERVKRMRITGPLTRELLITTEKHLIAIEQSDPIVQYASIGYGIQSFDPQHSPVPADYMLNAGMLEKLYRGYELNFKGNGKLAACESAWNFKGCNADDSLLSLPDRLDPDALAAVWVVRQRQLGFHFNDFPLQVRTNLELIAAHDCRRLRVQKPELDPNDITKIVAYLKTTVTYRISNFIGICVKTEYDKVNNKAVPLLPEAKLQLFNSELYNPTKPHFFTDEHLIQVAHLGKDIVHYGQDVMYLNSEYGSGLLVELLYAFKKAERTIAILHQPQFKGFSGKDEPINKFSVMMEEGEEGFIDYFKTNIQEKGWDGNSGGIIGSPFKQSSVTSHEDLIQYAQQYLV